MAWHGLFWSCILVLGMAEAVASLLGTNYSKRTIHCISELRPGDHIRVLGGIQLYDHHMLVVEVVGTNKIRVIHYTGEPAAQVRKGSGSFSSFQVGGDTTESAEIVEEELELDDPSKVEVLDYQAGVEEVSGEEAIRRARTRLGEKNYNLVGNNCECLVNWAKTGKNVSNQAVGGLASLGFGMVQRAYETRSWTGTLFGAVEGYLNFREKRS